MLKYEGVDLDSSLAGKTAIITGGAAGIGYATRSSSMTRA